MTFRIIDRLFLVTFGADEPTDAEWWHFLRVVTAHGWDRIALLITTEGGAPNALQRRYLIDAVDNRHVLTAVLSDSAEVRGVITVLSWFNLHMVRVFAHRPIDPALDHLKIPRARGPLLEREIKKLREALSTRRVA